MMTGEYVNGFIALAFGAVFGGGAVAWVVYMMLSSWHQSSQCLPRAKEVATALGASVKTHTERKEKAYHVIGERSGYQARLIFDGRDSGKVELKLGSIAASLFLQYDRKAKADAQNQLNADHWNELEQQKYFLSQHVYFERDQQRLREEVAQWKQLPDELARRIIQEMEARTIERVMVAGQTITIKVKDTAVIRPGFALQMLDLAVALATAINAPGYVAA